MFGYRCTSRTSAVSGDVCHVCDVICVKPSCMQTTRVWLIVITCVCVCVCLLDITVSRGGYVMVRVLAHDTKGRGFDSRPFRFHVTTLGKLFTHMRLCHQAVQFGTGQGAVMPCGWEGNRRSGVALAMRHRLQWFIQLRAHGLDKDMSTPPTLSCTVRPIYLLPVYRNGWADRGAVWGMDSGRPMEPCIMWKSGSPLGKINSGASPSPL